MSLKISILPLLIILSAISISSNPNKSNEGANQLTCENGDLCTCIAAGGCTYQPGSSCRIEFCSGTIETDKTNSKAANITTVQQPCPSEGGSL